jgi:hypothetical protein
MPGVEGSLVLQARARVVAGQVFRAPPDHGLIHAYRPYRTVVDGTQKKNRRRLTRRARSGYW